MPISYREQEESGLVILILCSCNISINILIVIHNLFDIIVPTAHRRISKLHDWGLEELFIVKVNV